MHGLLAVFQVLFTSDGSKAKSQAQYWLPNLPPKLPFTIMNMNDDRAACLLSLEVTPSSMALGVPDTAAHMGPALRMELTSHVPGREFFASVFNLLTSTDHTCPAHRSTDWLREPKQPDCGLYACIGGSGGGGEDTEGLPPRQELT